MKTKKVATFFIWCALVACFFILFQLQSENHSTVGFRPFESFVADVNAERVSEVWIDGNKLTVETYAPQSKYTVTGQLNDELSEKLSDQGVRVEFGEPHSPFASMLTVWLPIALIVILFFYFARRSQGTNILQLRKSKARELAPRDRVMFADVGGCSEAKVLLKDVIDFLKDSSRWKKAGVRLPRGVLLEGPPGCGKTLLARAIAGETNAKFFAVSASEFVEMFVGVGAARIRDMFETAAKESSAVIFIDELDAVGRRRGSGIGAAHDEREQTLNQLLVCMDGFERFEKVVVIAATNRADILDQALLRPGRFDRRVIVPLPSAHDRVEILKIHSKNKKLASDVSLDEVAKLTEGWHGASLETLMNESMVTALRASQNGHDPEMKREHVLHVLDNMKKHSRDFDKVDSVLIESATQLAEAGGHAIARIYMLDGSSHAGAIIWADGTFIKLRRTEDNETLLLPKRQIISIERLAGTDTVRADEVQRDPWAGKPPGLA